MKLTKVMLVLLATVSAVLLKAEIRSWDFSNPAIWKEGNPGGLRHDFGNLAKITPEGMLFYLDNRDHRIWFSNISEELNKARFIEVYHRDGGMIYGFYCYGEGDHGFETTRRHNGSWTRNERYYPERHIVPVNTIERWAKGGVKSACFAFASSGIGQESSIQAIVFRRGQDTLAN